jgi:cytoskeletal protein RodZ
VDYADFGRYLAQQRELRGLSREEVSQATRIAAGMLAALEEGRIDRLPGRVFVLNYVRAYACAIGLQPEDAVLRFEEVDRTVKASPPPAALERARRKKALWILAAVVAALGLGLYAALATLGAASGK